jgi:hypothetical protein
MNRLDAASSKAPECAFPPGFSTQVSNATDQKMGVPSTARPSKFFGDNPADGGGSNCSYFVEEGSGNRVVVNLAAQAASANASSEVSPLTSR